MARTGRGLQFVENGETSISDTQVESGVIKQAFLELLMLHDNFTYR